ncbi:acetoacetate decarboxylase [Mycobacterium gordonae]|uniref:Acetoacetate decarboxylase n=1 Tax=Mycobacterium gordonae TaxID=1778 RepID=A0A0Q2U3G6_MYCGO|nr:MULTISPECIES: acetoacetate decarboxylase family protein [Mycobacterium]KQH75296.1 acetoacetate decarboxylase [Mycobacterium gordonae]MDP7727352.1 acetoacetate decarboxylase family protein [Mycobacterium sp. TY813]
MNWEPTTRTDSRTLGGDLRRALALADPRRTLYHDAQYFTATVEVDPDRMRPWLPAGVRLVEPARADVFTAFFPDCNYGSVYHEAGVFVHIKAGRRTGIHCPWMILDDDVALILGRELLGYPKKLGEIDWQLNDTAIEAAATRRGHKLISMSGRLGEVLTDAPPILGLPHRNVAGSAGLFLPWILAFTPAETPIEVRRIDNFELNIAGSERDPIDQMGLGRVVEARLHRVDLSAGTPPIPIRPLTPLFTMTRLRPRVL